MESIRLGVVGAGFMGMSYAHIIHRHPLATLAGVAEPMAERQEQIKATLGAPTYASWDGLIDRESLQGIIVALPEHMHEDVCIAALESGIAVLVEKPLANTIASCEAIIAAAKRGGASLMVGHILRFDNRYALVKEAVATGQLGTPLTAWARRLNGTASPARLNGRTTLPLFLGVHDYDILRWTLGSEVTQVYARERRGFLESRGLPVEDANHATLTFANGAIASVELNWILPDGHQTGFDQRLDVTGTLGRIELTGHDGGLQLSDQSRLSWPDTMLWPTVGGEIVGALWRETSHFVECLVDGRAPSVSGEDGLAAVRIALAVQESAKTNAPVNL
jgi:predicted dehydrogenase